MSDPSLDQSPAAEQNQEGRIDEGSSGSAEAPSELRLFATEWVRRRSRIFGFFLLVNWVVMGWYVLRTGNQTVRLIAFPLGLFALLGGLSQLRGLRLATRLPLVEVTADRLRYRRFTGAQLREVSWSDLSPDFEATSQTMTLQQRDGADVDLPWLSLTDEDQRQLTAELQRRLHAS